MTQLRKFRLAVLTTALATTAAFAGTYTALDETSEVKPPAYNDIMAVTPTETVVAGPNDVVTVAAEESIAPAEPVRTSDPAVLPVKTDIAVEPPVTVTEQRLTTDQRIQADVMDLLARSENLSGQIGVESRDSVVTLSGWTATSGQAWRAGRDAGRVIGVKHVVNEIRPRIGAITS
jgi:hypothetical protein